MIELDERVETILDLQISANEILRELHLRRQASTLYKDGDLVIKGVKRRQSIEAGVTHVEHGLQRRMSRLDLQMRRQTKVSSAFLQRTTNGSYEEKISFPKLPWHQR
ncbi:hypothetical protein V6N13_020365 [Hibiscus sabdariffa]